MTDPSELRNDPRKAMFVAAEMVIGAALTPVKIRNMSTTGALVEGAVIPPVGTPIRLVRGPFSAMGTITWVESGRGGVKLSGSISVEDWIKGKLPDHQQRVDALIAELRSSGIEPQSIAAAEIKPSFEQSAVGADEELRAVTELLSGLEDALIDDPHVVANHAEALQKIDEAQQRIAALIRRVTR